MSNKNSKSLLTDPQIDFAKWYSDLVHYSELASYAPVKGTIFFKPYATALWKQLQNKFNQAFLEHKIEDVYFPLLIPEDMFALEKNHIKGFAPEAALVTKVGDKNLNSPLVLRPTSEILFCHYFSKNLSSYKQLPVVYNQWANIIRWEMTTKPFLRTTEFLWQEGHGVFENKDAAKKFTLDMIMVYKKILEKELNIPVVVGKKSELEKFAGAEFTYTIETLLPDFQALQLGTSHYLGINFSKAFKIQVSSHENKPMNPFQVSFGVSTRLIGGIIMSHGDKFGLIMPPNIAPCQIIVILQNDSQELKQFATKIVSQLKDRFRIKVDDSPQTFGFKIKNAEIKGIPARIEIGKKELETKRITIANRLNRTKETINLHDIDKYFKNYFVNFSMNLFKKAKNIIDTNTYYVKEYSKYKVEIVNNPGLYLVPFCGQKKCELEIKEETSTVTRCMPIEQPDLSINQKCFKCNSTANAWYFFARAY